MLCSLFASTTIQYPLFRIEQVACGFSSFDAVRLAEALSRRYGPLRDAAPVTEEEHRMQILDLLLHSPVADVLDHLSALALVRLLIALCSRVPASEAYRMMFCAHVFFSPSLMMVAYTTTNHREAKDVRTSARVETMMRCATATPMGQERRERRPVLERSRKAPRMQAQHRPSRGQAASLYRMYVSACLLDPWQVGRAHAPTRRCLQHTCVGVCVCGCVCVCMPVCLYVCVCMFGVHVSGCRDGLDFVEHFWHPLPTPSCPSPQLLHLEGKGDGSFDRAWRVNTHKCVDASPLLVTRERDTEEPWAIIGSHSGHVVCVRGSDGEEVWRTVLPGRVEASAALAHGDRVVVGVCAYTSV